MKRRDLLRWAGLTGLSWLAEPRAGCTLIKPTLSRSKGVKPVIAFKPLPPDPFDAYRLENDVLGVRLWGPPSSPTLSLGKADIWDRRWFGDRQPPVTMAKIRELARADRLHEIVNDPNNTLYDAYMRYDFPCPKPGAQLILETPFASEAKIEPIDSQSARLLLAGGGKRLAATIWVALTRPLVAMELEADDLAPEDFQVRLYRHTDTILPGEPVDPTLGGGPSGRDFEPLPAPRACEKDGCWGVLQEMLPDSTFPQGFRFAAAAAARGAAPAVSVREGERGLGTPLWAEQEGRLGHGVIKRYTPINNAPGACAEARFPAVPKAIFATIATTQDGEDPLEVASGRLAEACRLGTGKLRREHLAARRSALRKMRAQAHMGESAVLAAPPMPLPSLRRPGGFYGDIALCSVDSTKFAVQDAAMWHADFHLNEIRAEGMLTLGQFEEVLPYCDMIHTLLPQARDNAREVYGLPGAMYPLAHFPLRCRGIAHTNLTWEQDIGLNGLVSKPLWLYFRHTGDEIFLKTLAYPVLRECARFCAAYLSEGEDGRLHAIPTVSPEHWGLTPRFERNKDCASALALIRYLLRAAAAAARILNLDAGESDAWQKASERLAPYPTYETPSGPVWVDVAGAPPIEYNIPVPLSPVFWGDDVGLDSPPEVQAVARRTLEQINVWVPHRGYLDASVRPRLGIYRPGMAVNAECLLQSYQSIRLFPAVPPEGEIAIEHFAAEGGFRVSAVRDAGGRIRDVRIRSVLGGPCRIANPWPGRAVKVMEGSGKELLRLPGTETHIAFDTLRGKVYELRV